MKTATGLYAEEQGTPYLLWACAAKPEDKGTCFTNRWRVSGSPDSFMNRSLRRGQTVDPGVYESRLPKIYRHVQSLQTHTIESDETLENTYTSTCSCLYRFLEDIVILARIAWTVQNEIRSITRTSMMG
jgi:hypothetical protein